MLPVLALGAILAAADVHGRNKAWMDSPTPGRDGIPRTEAEYANCMEDKGGTRSRTPLFYRSAAECGLRFLYSDFASLPALCQSYMDGEVGYDGNMEDELHYLCQGACEVARSPYCLSLLALPIVEDWPWGALTHSITARSLVAAYVIEAVFVIIAAAIGACLLAHNKCDCFEHNEGLEQQ
jgi:hypothetical protein